MKIVIIGAAGTIGRAVVDLLAPYHNIVKVGFKSGDLQVDIVSKDSIRKLFQNVGSFDSVSNLIHAFWDRGLSYRKCLTSNI